MSQSIVLSFIHFAADEGEEKAIEKLEQIQVTLEDLAEVGGPSERVWITGLLTSVKFSINQILNTNAVTIARQEKNDIKTSGT